MWITGIEVARRIFDFTHVQAISRTTHAKAGVAKSIPFAKDIAGDAALAGESMLAQENWCGSAQK